MMRINLLCLLLLGALAPMHAGAVLSDVDRSARDAAEHRILASRFLHQATFGPTLAEIDSLAAQIADKGERKALEDWLEKQFSLPFDKDGASSLEGSARSIIAADGFAVDTNSTQSESLTHSIQAYKHHAWWDRVLRGEDQLRQRVARALAQVLVVSERGMGLNARQKGHWLGLLDYYDLLLSHAFGSYRDLLHDVALHPVMGLYLSHVKNAKARPAIGRFPDENFARELMQLFSTGVYQLGANGERVLDADGQPVEVYSNADVRSFARVFTGLGYAPRQGSGRFGKNPRYMFAPMKMYQAQHDSGEKQLLGGTVLPAGQGGMKDISDAIDNVVAHDSTAPFIAHKLIQRFTSSNPSPAYVHDVASSFRDDGKGQRGNLRAVISTILLHDEARRSVEVVHTQKPNGRWRVSLVPTSSRGGKVREPQLALAALLRGLEASPTHADGRFRLLPGSWITNQALMTMSSVFGFYRSDYRPSGALSNEGLAAPEMSLLTPLMLNRLSNFARASLSRRGVKLKDKSKFGAAWIDATPAEPASLVDHINLVFCAGTLNASVAEALTQQAAAAPSTAAARSMIAAALLAAPDFMIIE